MKKKKELPKRMNQEMEEAYREFRKRRREDDQKRRRMSYAARSVQFKLKIPDGGFTFDSLMNELVAGAGGMKVPITFDGAMKTLKRITENKPIDDTSESVTDSSNDIFEAVVENKPIDDTSELNKLR